MPINEVRFSFHRTLPMSSAPLFRQAKALSTFVATAHLKDVPSRDPSSCAESTDMNVDPRDFLFRSCPRGRCCYRIITVRAMGWDGVRNHFVSRGPRIASAERGSFLTLTGPHEVDPGHAGNSGTEALFISLIAGNTKDGVPNRYGCSSFMEST